MYKGIMQLEAFTNPDPLKKVHIIKEKKEHRPEATIKNWNTYFVEIDENKIIAITTAFSKALKPDWYVLFWNDTWAHFVFLNKIFKISRDKANKEDFAEIKKYATKQGIQEEYLNFKNELIAWQTK